MVFCDCFSCIRNVVSPSAAGSLCMMSATNTMISSYFLEVSCEAYVAEPRANPSAIECTTSPIVGMIKLGPCEKPPQSEYEELLR